MNEDRVPYAIREIVDNFKTDYNTIEKKIKRYQFKRTKKMYNGRLCKAVFLTQKEYDAIEHELEYNRQKKPAQKLPNEQIFTPNEQAENKAIIDLPPLSSDNKDPEKYLKIMSEGYLIALNEKDKRLEDKDRLIDRLEKDLVDKDEQILTLKAAQNKHNNKQKNLLTGLLNLLNKKIFNRQ